MEVIKLGHYGESFENVEICNLFGDFDQLLNSLILKKSKKVCHYFPKSALLSIIKDKRFYFSDVEFLNDYSESKSFYDSLIKSISEVSTESAVKKMLAGMLRIRNLHFNGINYSKLGDDTGDGFIYNRRSYVFCCSLDDDCLSNWKYYGKGDGYEAYNLSFSSQRYLDVIKKGFQFKEYKCLSGKVVYDDKIKQRFISELVQKLDSFIIESNPTQNLMYALQARLYYFLLDISLFFKDSSYKDENEYRFVIIIDNSVTKSNGVEYDFRFVNNLLVPYIKVPFEKEMIELLVMGPNMYTDISVKSTSALLRYYGYDTTIGVSTIPLRY